MSDHEHGQRMRRAPPRVASYLETESEARRRVLDEKLDAMCKGGGEVSSNDPQVVVRSSVVVDASPVAHVPAVPVDHKHQHSHVLDDDNEESDGKLRKEHSETEMVADSEPDCRYEHQDHDQNGDDTAKTDRPEPESDREHRHENEMDDELSVLRERKCVLCALSADAYEQALVGSEWTDNAHAENFIGPLHIRKMRQQKYAHRLCVIWCPQVVEGSSGELLNVEEEIARSRSLVCPVCKKKGGVMGCWEPRCRRSYHLPCAIQEKCTLDRDTFRLWCPRHPQPDESAEDTDDQRPDHSRPDNPPQAVEEHPLRQIEDSPARRKRRHSTSGRALFATSMYESLASISWVDEPKRRRFESPSLFSVVSEPEAVAAAPAAVSLPSAPASGWFVNQRPEAPAPAPAPAPIPAPTPAASLPSAQPPVRFRAAPQLSDLGL